MQVRQRRPIDTGSYLLPLLFQPIPQMVKLSHIAPPYDVIPSLFPRLTTLARNAAYHKVFLFRKEVTSSMACWDVGARGV